MVKKPSEKLKDLLTGATAWDDADPATRSWARFTIWKAARIMSKEKSFKKRVAMLDKLPETLRPVARDMWDENR